VDCFLATYIWTSAFKDFGQGIKLVAEEQWKFITATSMIHGWDLVNDIAVC
jgi:hypothetical protein